MNKKINWKIFNIALWIEVILCYLLPFKAIDDFHSSVGFPIPFITVGNNRPIDINPFSSMSFNPGNFIINGIIIYLIISFGIKVYYSLINNHRK